MVLSPEEYAETVMFVTRGIYAQYKALGLGYCYNAAKVIVAKLYTRAA